MQLRTELVGGVELEVARVGRGSPTVVVVPGFGAGIESYRSFLALLGADWTAVGVSVRGVGRSQWAAPYAVDDWVDDVTAVVRELAAPPIIAIGHSFGAYLALAAAAREPNRIAAAVSLDQVLDLDVFVPLARPMNEYWQAVRRTVAAHRGDERSLVATLGDIVGPQGRLGEVLSREELEAMAARWAVQDPRVLEFLTDDHSAEWLTGGSLPDLPGRVRCPVLRLDGDPSAGSIVSDASATAAELLYPASRHVRLEGLGHQLDLDERPAVVVDHIRSFIDELS
ncbi:MAG: alpha/beta hydrolase [Actinomycetota bacterium]